MIPSLRAEMQADAWQLMRRDQPSLPFLWHYHTEFEVLVVYDGGGQCLVGDWQGTFSPGDVFLVPPMVPHSFSTVGTGPRRVGTSRGQVVSVLFFRPEAALLRLTCGEAEIDALSRRWPGGVRLPPAQAQRVAASLRAYREDDRQAPAAPDAARRLAATAAFLSSVAVLVGMRDGEPLARPKFVRRAVPGAAAAERMNVVGGYLQQRYASKVRLSELARLTGMGVPGLCRFFRRTTGTTLTSYLRELRIRRACQQLTDTDDSVSAIALRSGFATISHFNRAFRAVTDTTPRRFRAASRRQAAVSTTDAGQGPG